MTRRKRKKIAKFLEIFSAVCLLFCLLISCCFFLNFCKDQNRKIAKILIEYFIDQEKLLKKSKSRLFGMQMINREPASTKNYEIEGRYN